MPIQQIGNQERIQKNWNVVNTTTIVDWISSSNLNILLLDNYLVELRTILQLNTLWSLLISSVTSTISVTQFTISDTTDPLLSLVMKVVIAATSIITSMITGYIKVQKIQESIEKVEEHKHKWLKFMMSLSSELQVGCEFRTDANQMIGEKKDEFNAVNSKRVDVPDRIRVNVSQFLLKKSQAYNALQQTPGCCTRLFRCSACCIWTEETYNVEKLNIKLSFYHSIMKELKKELLALMESYPDEVSEIEFNQDSDLFVYKIKNATLDKSENTREHKSTFKLRTNCMQSIQRLPESPVAEEV